MEDAIKMKIQLRLLIIGMLIVVTTTAVDTQFALLDLDNYYEEPGHEIIIPTVPDYGLKFIGSDNSSDLKRLLRMNPNDSDSYEIFLGNLTSNYQLKYTAAFGIVNEDNVSQHITHIEIISSNANYLKIWLHGDRDKPADISSDDPTSVLMYDNGTIISNSDTIAWTLAVGD